VQDKLAMLEGGIKTEKGEDIPIYDDLGDYKPRKEDLKREDDRRRGDHHRRDDYRSSRDDDRRRDRDRGDRRERYDRRGEEEEDRGGRRTYFDRSSEQEVEEHRGGFSTQDKQMIKNLIKKQEEKDKAKVRRKYRITSVPYPLHFGVDPDPRIHASD
jgi:hypothetical protein